MSALSNHYLLDSDKKILYPDNQKICKVFERRKLSIIVASSLFTLTAYYSIKSLLPIFKSSFKKDKKTSSCMFYLKSNESLPLNNQTKTSEMSEDLKRDLALQEQAKIWEMSVENCQACLKAQVDLV